MTYPLRVEVLRKSVDYLSLRLLKSYNKEIRTRMNVRYPRISELFAIRQALTLREFSSFVLLGLLNLLSLMPPLLALRIIHFLIRTKSLLLNKSRQ